MRSAPDEHKVTTLPGFNPSESEVVAEIKRRTDELIQFIEENVPSNRQRSIALTNYEQAAMWAVKANFV
jgi:hypothetical protein